MQPRNSIQGTASGELPVAILFFSNDYRGIYRLVSYMNKDEGSEVNHCCQVFAIFSASVTKLISHIFCINFVIVNFVIYINFVMYNLC